jgi:hypothetical protein
MANESSKTELRQVFGISSALSYFSNLLLASCLHYSLVKVSRTAVTSTGSTTMVVPEADPAAGDSDIWLIVLSAAIAFHPSYTH